MMAIVGVVVTTVVTIIVTRMIGTMKNNNSNNNNNEFTFSGALLTFYQATRTFVTESIINMSLHDVLREAAPLVPSLNWCRTVVV